MSVFGSCNKMVASFLLIGASIFHKERFCYQINSESNCYLLRNRCVFQEEIFVARAPGRLDVMGGIADYSGSLVLQVKFSSIGFAGHCPISYFSFGIYCKFTAKGNKFAVVRLIEHLSKSLSHKTSLCLMYYVVIVKIP